MLNCRVIGTAGRALASAILLMGRVPPGQDVSLVNVAGGIGLPFSVLFPLRVIVQSCESEGDSLMKSADPRKRGFLPCAVD
jgi:hypothetical protein